MLYHVFMSCAYVFLFRCSSREESDGRGLMTRNVMCSMTREVMHAESHKHELTFI
jgi:hypothetical protein